jgi:hypothetical protein
MYAFDFASGAGYKRNRGGPFRPRSSSHHDQVTIAHVHKRQSFLSEKNAINTDEMHQK